jgi:hypothetical protein
MSTEAEGGEPSVGLIDLALQRGEPGFLAGDLL